MLLEINVIKEQEVTYTLEVSPEDCPVRGNVLACGDDDADRAAEDEVLARLDRGEVWAWCCVRVVAHWRGFAGDAYLGCCSYQDAADFKHAGGYWEDMCNQACYDLEAAVNSLEARIHAS